MPSKDQVSDELDEIVLRPATWQLDDYRKAKAKLEALIHQRQSEYAVSKMRELQTRLNSRADTAHELVNRVIDAAIKSEEQQ